MEPLNLRQCITFDLFLNRSIKLPVKELQQHLFEMLHLNKGGIFYEQKVSKEKDEITMAKQRKQAFENIMANVKPMLMDGIGKNSHMVTALANVPI